MSEYPDPVKLIEHEAHGQYLIKPVDVYQEDGESICIEDHYERVVIMDASGEKWDGWRFFQRIKTYSEPHLSQTEFNKCDICKQLGRKYGVTKPTEVMIKDDWDIGYGESK